MEVILLTIYTVTWVLINGIIYKTGMISTVPPLTPMGLHISPVDAAEMGAATRLTYLAFGLISIQFARHFVRIVKRVIPANAFLILFQTLMFLGFLLFIFLGPHIQYLNEEEEKARKQVKQYWLEAINNRNRYYILSFCAIAIVPFVYMIWFCYSLPAGPPPPLIDWFENFLLELTAGFNGIISFLYTAFTLKPWFFYIIPSAYLFSFVFAENTDNNFLPRLKKFLLSIVLLIWPFFFLSTTSIYWSIPFMLAVVGLHF